MHDIRSSDVCVALIKEAIAHLKDNDWIINKFHLTEHSITSNREG